jgi:hypothetical protein
MVSDQISWRFTRYIRRKLTAIATITVSDQSTHVSVADLVSVLGDMESGLCGRSQEGKGGNIEGFSVSEVESAPVITVNVTEQDCTSRVIERKQLQFVLRDKAFELAP